MFVTTFLRPLPAGAKGRRGYERLVGGGSVPGDEVSFAAERGARESVSSWREAAEVMDVGMAAVLKVPKVWCQIGTRGAGVGCCALPFFLCRASRSAACRAAGLLCCGNGGRMVIAILSLSQVVLRRGLIVVVCCDRCGCFASLIILVRVVCGCS